MKITKTLLYAVTALMTTALPLTSCQMEDDLRGNKKSDIGYLDATITPQATEPMLTRAEVDAQYDLNEFPAAIVSTADGDTVYRFCNYREMKARGEIALPAGDYKVITWLGSDDENIQLNPYFEGAANFTVVAQAKTPVSAVCRLARVKVSVTIDDDFEHQFEDDYSLTFNNDHGVETMDKDTKDQALYFKLHEGDKSIEVTVKATPKGSTQTIVKKFSLIKQGEDGLTGEGLDLEPGDAFKINLSPSTTEDGTIGNPTEGNFIIGVDLKWNDRSEEVSIPINVIDVTPSTSNDNPGNGNTDNGNGPTLTPNINGKSTWSLTLAKDESATLSVQIDAPATIQSLVVKISSTDEGFTNAVSAMELTEFDLCHVEEGSKTAQNLETMLQIGYNDEVMGKTSFVFDVTMFTAALSNFPGQHAFELTVTDGDGQTASGTLSITCNN